MRLITEQQRRYSRRCIVAGFVDRESVVTSLRVGIDVGGTFTDVTVLDENAGLIREVRKVPSNPMAPLEVLDGVLADMRARWGTEAISYTAPLTH